MGVSKHDQQKVLLTRRQALIGLGAAALSPVFAPRLNTLAFAPEKAVKRGRLKQSVSRWCYNKIPMPDFCRAVADMGLTAIDLLQEAEWETLRQYGLICSMGYGGGGTIPEALNNPANHDTIIASLEKSIPKAAKLGVPNIITFFGNRRGLSDTEAAENCVKALNRIKRVAEDNGVTICVELLNSKRDHKGYQGDHSEFGLGVVKAVGSPRVKLLFDIYHMQIMEGDVIQTIRQNHEFIAHYHTGG
ncbi:MAG TPA: sugar phosphate isomerase/epimerase family protein, partial [Blastocatellia bacterium]|nr:sugar phosphate isomerase/epimerase family protein [Blastocatellia bacterium]